MSNHSNEEFENLQAELHKMTEIANTGIDALNVTRLGLGTVLSELKSRAEKLKGATGPSSQAACEAYAVAYSLVECVHHMLEANLLGDDEIAALASELELDDDDECGPVADRESCNG